VDFLGYQQDEDIEPPLKMTCETDEELDSAITYLQERINFRDDQSVFNYGKNEIETVGGVHIESLLTEGLKIKDKEYRVERNGYGSFIEDKAERQNSGNWFRF